MCVDLIGCDSHFQSDCHVFTHEPLFLLQPGDVGQGDDGMSEDPLQPHAHDPNLVTPEGDGSFVLVLGNGRTQSITVTDLQQLPFAEVSNCFIVSTGHGTSGPFTFGGVTLMDFINHHVTDEWREVEVVSVDGFGNRVYAQEILHPDAAGPVLLSYTIDGMHMMRAEGLVRLIVPNETDDALRQVKWIGEIRVI